MVDRLGWIDVVTTGSGPIVKVYGEVDISNVADIEKELDRAMSDSRARHVIDLSETTYFDSSGIRVLFALATRLRSRRQELHIVVPTEGVTRRVLELTGLPNIAPLHATVQDADRTES